MNNYINDSDRVTIETTHIKDFTNWASPKYWTYQIDCGKIFFLDENKKMYFTNKINNILQTDANSKQKASIKMDDNGILELFVDLVIVFNQQSNYSDIVFYIKVNECVKYKIKDSTKLKICLDVKKDDELKFVIKLTNDCTTKFNLTLDNFLFKYTNKKCRYIDIFTLKDLLNDNEYENENKDYVGDIGPQGNIGCEGFQGVRGIVGYQGDVGHMGFQGPYGIKGIAGYQGNDGIRGSLWVNSMQNNIQNNNYKDQYLDKSNGNIYENKITTWVNTGNIKGLPGADGKKFRYIKKTMYKNGSGIHQFDQNTKTIFIQMVGGGGAGGGTESLSRSNSLQYILYGVGGSGGSGAYCESWLSLDVFPDFSYTVGNGGSGIYVTDQTIAQDGTDTIINNTNIGFELISKGGKGGKSLAKKFITDQLPPINSFAIGGLGGNNTGVNANANSIYYINGANGNNGIANTSVLSTNFSLSPSIPLLVSLSVIPGDVTDPSLGNVIHNASGGVFNGQSQAVSKKGVSASDFEFNYGGGGGGAFIVIPSSQPDPNILIQNGGDGANGFLSITEFGI